MGIENYSKTASNNNQPPPNGWPEGMFLNEVNNTARQNMADLRTWYEDSQWVNLGYVHTYASANSFIIATTNYTSIYHVGRRVKAVGLSTGLIYGTITAVNYVASTTVTVSWDNGVLQNETLTIYLSILTKISDSIPYLNKQAADVASAATIDLNAVRGDLIDITGTTTISAITLDQGQERTIRFTAAGLILVNSSNLVLFGGNISTLVGDFCVVRGYANGVVRCVNYFNSYLASYSTKPMNVLASELVPAGTVSSFAAPFVPAGWLYCDGGAVSRVTYSSLFANIGTWWGGGDGSTTFNIPDLRGEFIRGYDNGKGVDPGRGFATSQSDTLQNFTGAIDLKQPSYGNIYGIQTLNGTGVLASRETASVYNDCTQQGVSSRTTGITFDASRNARTSFETRPRNKALSYIIKY